MTDDTAAVVRALLKELAPGVYREQELGDEMSLGASGLGLDSVARVELLLKCEEAFQIPFPESLLAEGGLTIGRLVAHVRGARAGRRPG